jgi:hypothetical protein
MRAQQREFRFAVVKSVDVRPGLRVVASLTSERRPIRPFPRHAIVELSLVRVLMASGAGPVFKFEWQNLVGAASCAKLVTVDARNRRMRARQRETRVSMLGDGKRSAMEIQNRVAAFTLVVIRRGGKLVVMGILVAIAAGSKLYFVNRVLARWDVALRALHLDVFALQWILGCVVLLHSEWGWLPPFHVVAFRALAFSWTGLKLALVRIRLVTVVAVRECELFLEVAVNVARHAGDLRVFARQGIFRFRMVKIKSRQHRFPTAGGVAGIAGFLELSLVRINVAGGAGIKIHVAITRGPSLRIRLVALFAGHSRMQAGERIPRFGMVEVFGCFPVLHVVALGALVAELAFVRIVVAGLAKGGKSEIGFGEIFILDERAVCGDHVGRRVALFARQRRVLPLQVVARQAMIEFFPRRLPMDKIVILPIVFQVTANAILPVRILHLQPRVISMVSRNRLRHFLVTIEALKGGSAGPERMAGCALCRAAER